MINELAHTSSYYADLARAARLEAAGKTDAKQALRLKEAAVRHERMVRKLRAAELL